MTTSTAAATRSLLTTRLFSSRTSVGSLAVQRRPYSSRPPKGPNVTVKFWPFLAIIVVGTGAFAYVSKSRAGQGRAPIARNEIPNR